MSKAIKYTFAILLILVIAGFLLLTFTIDSIVKSSIEDIGTEMTGTPVTVDGVSISPFSGEGSIRGFRVANPGEYSRDYALEIESISIKMKPLSLFSDEIIVEEVRVMDAAVYVEQKLPENNIHEILSRVQAVSSRQTTDANLVIDYFLMQNASADLYTEVGGEREERVELSEIELTDLGRTEGRQAVEDVIQQIAEQVAEKSLQAALQSGGEQIRDAIRDLFD